MWIVMIKSFNTLLYKIVNKILRSMHVCIKKIKKVSHPDEIQNIIIYYYIIFVRRRYYIYLLSIRKLFGIAASTLFGKCLTVKNVRCTWYRLSNITVYSFHTLSTFLTVKNVRCTWYRLSNITVYSFHTLSTFLFF